MVSADNTALKTKKPKPPKPKYSMFQNVWFMVKLAWTSREKKVILLSLLSAGLTVALNLINLYVSPSILGAMERKAPIPELLWMIALFTAGIMLVSAASAYVTTNIQFGRITVRLGLLGRVSEKSTTTSYPNIDKKDFNELREKALDVVKNNKAASQAIWDTLTNLTAAVLGFLLYVRLLTAVQPVLVIVVLVTSATGYFLSNYLNGYGYRHRDEEAEYVKRMQYFARQSSDWGAAKDIRIFGLRPWLEELYNKAIDSYIAFHRKAEGIYIWARVADVVLTFLRSGVAYAYIIARVLSGGLGAAEFLLYFTAAGGFTQWVTGILSECSTLYKQSLDLSTLRECFDYPEPFQFEEGEPLKAENRDYEIQLENVSFRYPGAERDALHNINLTLHPGEKLAVVGLNGAGKTTMVKLICGFLDPTEGRVLLNGRDIRTFNRRDYYQLFSAVFQDFSLMAGSIAVNVAQKESNIDMERVRNAVGKAGLRQKIESLPAGYETKLNREVFEDAVMLSGGETQRLMLARALYRDAPFIVLDEPTAALDPISESEMYQKYNEMTSGKSSVYISHRLASTRFCNRIIMIGGGDICEEGTHDELLKLGGKYAELYRVQSKYYEEGGNGNEGQ